MKYFIILGLFFFFCNCKPNTKNGHGAGIKINTAIVENGEILFRQNCSSCHNFLQDGMGPNLNGLTRKVPTDWIKEHITNPSKLLAENDERTVELARKYPVLMPGFGHLKGSDIDDLISYMHSIEPISPKPTDNKSPLTDPIKDSLKYTSVVAHLEFITQIPASAELAPLARINKMECAGRTGRLFINDLRGSLYELVNNEPQLYFQLNEFEKDFMPQPGLGTGFGSFAFHPNFDVNGLFYTTHSEPAKTKPANFAIADSIRTSLQWVLKEWKASTPNAAIFLGTSREVLRVDFVGTIHGMQEIAFNPTAQPEDEDYGKLYIGLGDGASVQNGFVSIADHKGNGVWSSILRINPVKTNNGKANYAIPENNPFAGEENKVQELWAYGFRNPNRFAWDKEGALYVTDIGHSQIEEINLVEAGKFYGWPIREGSFELDTYGDLNNVYPLPENDQTMGVSYAAIEYDHTDGAAISGGHFVESSNSRNYIFGDIPTGWVYISDLNKDGKPTLEKMRVAHNALITDFRELTNSNRVDLRLGRDCDGTIYFFTKADGKIYQLRQLK